MANVSPAASGVGLKELYSCTLAVPSKLKLKLQLQVNLKFYSTKFATRYFLLPPALPVETVFVTKLKSALIILKLMANGSKKDNC